MITSIHSRPYRPGTLDVNQRLGQRAPIHLSRDLLRALAILLSIVVVLLGCWSLYIHWQVAIRSEKSVHLYAQLRAQEAKNIELRAIRAGLISKEQVTARAAQRLHLVMPDKNQVHRF